MRSFTYGAFGIYLDQASSNLVVANNTVFDTQCSGIFQHYGLNNQFDNNVVAFAATKGNRPLQPGAIGSGTHNRINDEGDRSLLSLTRNIVLITGNDARLYMSAAETGWSNATADRNLYWNAATGGDDFTFPCNSSPNGPSSHGECIYSNSGFGALATPDFISSSGAGKLVAQMGDGNDGVFSTHRFRILVPRGSGAPAPPLRAPRRPRTPPTYRATVRTRWPGFFPCALHPTSLAV